MYSLSSSRKQQHEQDRNLLDNIKMQLLSKMNKSGLNKSMKKKSNTSKNEIKTKDRMMNNFFSTIGEAGSYNTNYLNEANKENNESQMKEINEKSSLAMNNSKNSKVKNKIMNSKQNLKPSDKLLSLLKPSEKLLGALGKNYDKNYDKNYKNYDKNIEDISHIHHANNHNDIILITEQSVKEQEENKSVSNNLTGFTSITNQNNIHFNSNVNEIIDHAKTINYAKPNFIIQFDDLKAVQEELIESLEDDSSKEASKNNSPSYNRTHTNFRVKNMINLKNENDSDSDNEESKNLLQRIKEQIVELNGDLIINSNSFRLGYSSNASGFAIPPLKVVVVGKEDYGSSDIQIDNEIEKGYNILEKMSSEKLSVANNSKEKFTKISRKASLSPAHLRLPSNPPNSTVPFNPSPTNPSKYSKYNVQSLSYELGKKYAQIKVDNEVNFLERMEFYAVKKNMQEQKINELLNINKATKGRKEISGTFNRLIDDTNRRFKKKEKLTLLDHKDYFSERLHHSTVRNSKNWEEFYKKQLDAKIEKMKQYEIEKKRREEERKKEEEEIIAKMPKAKKVSHRKIEKIVNRLYLDNSKKTISINNNTFYNSNNKDNTFRTEKLILREIEEDFNPTTFRNSNRHNSNSNRHNNSKNLKSLKNSYSNGNFLNKNLQTIRKSTPDKKVINKIQNNRYNSNYNNRNYNNYQTYSINSIQKPFTHSKSTKILKKTASSFLSNLEKNELDFERNFLMNSKGFPNTNRKNKASLTKCDYNTNDINSLVNNSKSSYSKNTHCNREYFPEYKAERYVEEVLMEKLN